MSRVQEVIKKIREKASPSITMEHKGFKAGLMRAERLEDIGRPHGLPPGSPIPVFWTDALPGAPESWVRGPGSYVCPVDPEWGLWFDWTMNDNLNTSVLTSVKGMNPVTGQKLKSLSLEGYEEKCPIHDVPFKGELYCEKCDYQWPPQNYISSPNTLWWDGFRQPDGRVRQFFFSEDVQRDIASLVIGKKNVVPAFGFAFFETKTRREPPKQALRGGTLYSMSIDEGNFDKFGWYAKESLGNSVVNDLSTSSPVAASGDEGELSAQYLCSSPQDPRPEEVKCSARGGTSAKKLLMSDSLKGPRGASTKRRETAKKEAAKKIEVSVGAGAEIYQDLVRDDLKVSDWKDEASAIIRLYFVFADEFESIVNKGGVKDLKGNAEGYLKGLPTG